MDEDNEMYEIPISRVPYILEAAHQAIHDFPHDFQEVVVVALTRRDILMIGTALILLELEYPCLRPENADLQGRVSELREVQQPDWCAES